jgi:uncharacterized membrane protein YecN with MAPEG domain
MPVVTGFYLAILLLLYVLLSLQVSRYRRGNRVVFGDGDNIKLRSAIRAHANFAEYVPITVLMIAILETAGMPAGQVHWLMGVLLVSRLIHPLGLYVGPRTWQFQVCRVGGMTLTLFVMVSAVISGLVWFWPR